MINNLYKTFAIHTLGCKVNLYESESIANQLTSIGLIQVDFTTKADIYIINTCSVTNVADAKSRNMISRARNKNKNALIMVAGCYSQVASDEINKKLKVDIIIGNKFKNNITSLIEEYLENKNNTLIKIDNLLIEDEFEDIILDNYESKTRAFIKIQDGCNFMCSYCSIPFTRGKQRSANKQKIINDIKQFVANGFKEIVLTGVNTAGYLDKDGNNFYDLLKSINEINGDFRIRISSLEPFQITDEIIELITKNNKRFCRHWHICLQSGCNKTLTNMNRKYSTIQFEELINKIRLIDPLVSISTDIIVGFPSETIEDFDESYNFIKNIQFSFLHVFPYSKRRNTAASRMKDINNPKLKKQNEQKMLNLSKELKKIYLKKFINQEIEVLFEKYDNGYLIGKSSQYFEVCLKSNNKKLLNHIIKLRVNSCFGENLVCELIK